MKLFSKQRGQILIYFLIIATLIAMGWAGFMKMQMDQISRNLRAKYISGLKTECDINAAACRTAKADAGFYGSGREIQIKVRAVKNLIKVMDKMFQFSPQGRIQWVNLKNRMDALGLLKTDAEEVPADLSMADDVIRLCSDMQIFLVKVQAHDCNFVL
jgi:hypothetical protein